MSSMGVGAVEIGTLVVGDAEIVIAAMGIVEVNGIEEGSMENSV